MATEEAEREKAGKAKAERGQPGAPLSATKKALLDRLLRNAAQGKAAVSGAHTTAQGAIPRRSEAGATVLSFAQERLWFLDQFEPETPFYNVTGAFRLHGDLDPRALARALHAILERHEVLRSVVLNTAHGPRQRVQPTTLAGLPEIDLTALRRACRQQEVRRLAAAEARHLFRLDRDTLLRTTLLRESSGHHLLLLSLHHIAADGWSVGVLFRELGTLYQAFRTHRSPRLPPLPIQYADFAVWQRNWLEGGELERQLLFWRQALEGAPTVLELPADRPRPARMTFRGHTLRGHLGASTSQALEERAEAYGVTPFMLLLAAFQTLLWRYTGATDLLVGSPIANRNRLESEGLIGFFVNTLVLRGRPTPQTTVSNLLAQVKGTTVAAYDHQDLPFERLVEALEPPRDLSRPPLFQILFVLQNAPDARLEFPHLTLTMEQLDSGTAKFDLLLSMVRQGDELVPWAEYSTDLFDAPTILRLLAHQATVLRSLLDADPQTPLARLPLLTAGERRQLLEEFAAPEAPPAQETRPVHLRFAAIAQQHPHRVALVWQNGQLSYGELDHQAKNLATRLRREGAGLDHTIAIRLGRIPEMAITVLATLRTGSAYLPLDPTYPAARLDLMLKEAAPALEIASPPPSARPGRADGADGEGLSPSPSTRQQGTDSSLAYVMFTSGSTGRPKGVAMPHRPLAELISWQLARSRATRTLQFAPLSFDVSFQEHFATWLAGGTLVLVASPTRRDPEALWAHLTEQRIERLFLPFVALQQLAEAAPAVLAPLREVVTAGEQLRVTPALRRLFARLPQARLENQYGPSETHVATAHPLPADPSEWPLLPAIGRPVAGALTYVLDADFEPLPQGIPGDLYLGGRALARGYLHQPARTAARFLPNPYSTAPGGRLYRTGDRARYREGGALDFLGRSDDQVKVRGFRVELGEIEATLVTHPEVVEAIVTAPEGASGHRQLAAFLVARPGAVLERDALSHFLAERLPPHQIPNSFNILAALPLTPSGKVDRRALLHQPLVALHEDPAEPPQGPIEEAVAKIWAELLGRRPETLGRRQDFFALGGHSLLATRVVSRVRDLFAVEVAVRALFLAPTLEGFARRIAAAGRSGAPPLEATEDSRPLLSFAQERLWFLEQLEPESTAYHLPGVLSLVGDLQVGALQRAFDLLVQRHPSLTTTFSTVDGQPEQHPGTARWPQLAVVDLRDGRCTLGARQNRARALAAVEAGRAFDLARGPLVRARLLLLGEGQAWLLLIQHHIISDGWSLGILLRELSLLYRALVDGLEHPIGPLPTLPITYLDFAHWQRRWLVGAALESQLAWWRDRLAPPRARLDLPTDRPRNTATRRRGAHLEVLLSSDLTTHLTNLGRELGATHFMVLLAAWKILLGRWSGTTDLFVGCPVAGRTHSRCEELVGFFINTLVLRTELSGRPSFRDVVGRVRETALGALAHQDLPFAKLVEALEPGRHLGRSPLFQVFFNFLNFDEVRLDLPGIDVEVLSSGPPEAKFDLTLYAGERTTKEGQQLQLDLIYDADLFDRPRMEAHLAQFETLLHCVTGHPAAPVDEHDLRPTDPAPLPDPRRPLPPAPATLPIHQRILSQAALRPEAGALRAQDGTAWSYAELANYSAALATSLANSLATPLATATVGSGPVVAIEAGRTPALVGALLAVLRSGAAFCLLDPAHPAARRAELLRQARPAAFLRSATQRPVPEEIAKVLSQLPSTAVLELPNAVPTQDEGSGPLAEVAPDDLAYLAFTSGSTGRPKGIRGTHRPLSHFLEVYSEAFAITPQDRFTALSGLGHDPLLRDLFVPLTSGGCVLLPDLEQPAAALRWLRRQGATVAHLTPAMAEFLTSATEHPLPTLRLVGFGGDVLRQRDVDRLRRLAPQAACWNFYGTTETPQVMAWQAIDATARAPATRIPLGHGIEGVQLLVLALEGTPPRPAAIAELGEVVVRTPYLAAGYLDRQFDAGAFLKDPFGSDPAVRLYRTGDLGRHRSDGGVDLVGRRDAQVKIRGHRVEPTEIETVLLGHPAVHQATVLPMATEQGTTLFAFLTAAEPTALETQTLETLLAHHLPEAFHPRLVVVEELPRTSNGKIDRDTLRRWAAASLEEASEELPDEAPRTTSEALVASIWSQVLGRERIGRQQDFFTLGGHSLLAVQVLARLRQALGYELPLRSLFEHPTVAQLAAWLDTSPQQVEDVPLGAQAPGPAPLSPAQERLWFLHRLDPGPAYNMPVALRLRGRLDPAFLHAALAHILHRHSVLRSAFHQGQDGPTQTPQGALPVPFQLLDLSSLPAPLAAGEGPLRLRSAAQQPFDLTRPPLARLLLVRLADDHHLLLLTVHHIAADAWSFAILFAEFQHLATGGDPGRLPNLPVQVADVARWQRRRLADGRFLAADLAYWQGRLAGAPTLELATDRQRPATAPGGGGRVRFALPAATTRRLRTVCEAAQATPYMALLATFQVLLGRLAGQQNLVVGTAVAGRDRPELEPLVGLFVNTLPLRAEFSDAPSMGTLLLRTRQRVLEAHAHRELPFETLVEGLSLERRLDQNPLFQVMFVLQNQATARFELPGTTTEPLAVDTGAAKFDLVLHLIEGPQEDLAAGLDGWLEYRRDLFDHPTIARLARSYGQLLDAATKDTETAIDALPLLTPVERHTLLQEWNDTANPVPVPYGEATGLIDLFDLQVAQRPHAVALEDGHRTLSYGGLTRRVHRLAHRLHDLGVERGTPVAVHLPRTTELAVALLGVLAAGGAYVPLDLHFPTERVRWIVQRLAVPVLITSADLAERTVSNTGFAPKIVVPKIVVLEADEALSGPTTPLPHHRSPDDPAYIIFTSGSTGQPKGVVVRHRPVLNLIAWANRTFAIGPTDRVLWISSPSFDLSVYDLFGLLAAGGTVRLARQEEREDPRRLVDLLEHGGITFWDSAPPALARLVPFFQPSAVHRLRTVFLSGDWIPVPLPDEVRSAFPGSRVVALGGATEAVIWSNVFALDKVDPAWPSIPYGRPIWNARYHVLDHRLEPCPVGVEGNLMIAGHCLADGYVGAALTAERFLPDPFAPQPGSRLYTTGDRARHLADGNLEFRGRRDQQVKLRGYRVELGEIETVLGRHPAVRQAALGVRQMADDAHLLAWVVPTAAPAEPAALHEFLRRHLPEYMLPTAFIFLPALPVTANGKLDRQALPLPTLETPGTSDESPRGPLEELVANAWCEILGRRRVGRQDDFFDLGGHSLSATRVIAHLGQSLGVELPLRQLFENPTVAAMASALAALRAAAQGTTTWVMEPLGEDQRQAPPLALAQERLWFLHRLEPELAVYNIPLALELRGALEVGALAFALQALEQRHDILRRALRHGLDGPRQQLRAGRHLTQVDLEALPAARRGAELRRRVDAEARCPFELEGGVLWRTTVLRLAAEQHALLVTFHHLVADGWSLGVFVRELGHLYGAACDSRPADLKALPCTYVDFAVGQRRWLEDGGQARQLAYWKERLAGLPALLELPTDHPRPSRASYRGGRRPVVLPGPLIARVDGLARRLRATRFMIFLTALGTLLHRVSGHCDLALGSAVAGRHRGEVEGLIGLFVNSLVLRSTATGKASGGDLLAQARRHTLEAHDHQDLPFERLVEELAPHRGMNHNPLFQVMLVLQNTPVGTVLLPGLELRPLPADAGLIKFDLQLALDDGRQSPDGAVHGSFDYALDLFDSTTAERLARGFHRLLAALTSAPERPISELPLLSRGEHHQLVVEWNPGSPLQLGNFSPLAQEPSTLDTLFAARAAAQPNAPALTFEGTTLTYAALQRRSNQLAWRLRRCGVGPEIPVALYLDRGPDLVVAILAVLTAGGAYLPMDPVYPAERLAFLLEDSAAPVLLSQEHMLQQLDPVVKDQLRHRVVLELDRCSDLASEPTTALPPLAGPENLAYLIYTSGSTGQPKGALINHHNAVRLFRATAPTFDFGPQDVIALFHSAAFDFSVWEIWSALLFGGRLVIVPYLVSRSPADFRRLLAGEGVTVVNQTPSAFRQLEEADRLADPDRDGRLRLRRVIFGGEALDFASLRSWFERHGDGSSKNRIARGPRLINGYGITETTVFVSFRPVSLRDLEGPPGSYIGRAMADLGLQVFDRHGHPSAQGSWGELQIKGPGLGRGYLKRPALTAQRFVPDPLSQEPGARLYRSGDLVRYRPDGDLDYQGRIDHQVQLRGFRVELGEIEHALTSHPAVRASLVLVREESPGDLRLVAFLEGDLEALPNDEALRAFLEPCLPPYMIPAHFIALAAGLPLTANGKADRKALARHPLPTLGERSGTPYAAPRNALERRLVELWQAVLGVPRVGLDDNFFDLGGHSMLLASLHTRLEQELGRSIPLVELFHHSNIRSFAEFLGEPSTVPSADAPPPHQPSGFEQEKKRAARQIAALKKRRKKHPRRRP